MRLFKVYWLDARRKEYDLLVWANTPEEAIERLEALRKETTVFRNNPRRYTRVDEWIPCKGMIQALLIP